MYFNGFWGETLQKKNVLIKRILLMSSLAMMIIILSGCINLKIGNDLLKISSDGIEVVKDGATETDQTEDDSMNEDNESNTDSTEKDSDANKKDSTKDQKNNSDDNSNGSSSDSVPADQSSEKNNSNDPDKDELQKMRDELDKISEEFRGDKSLDAYSSGNSKEFSCPENINQDFSELQRKLDHEFYFPECSHLVYVDEKESSFSFVLQKMVDYKAVSEQPRLYEDEMEAVHEGYKKLGGDNVYYHFLYAADSYGVVDFYLHGNEKGDTNVHYQWDKEYITIEVTYTHS